ncbi:hypothetical protein NIES2119_12290 [[Phormidium ambiguum] IAM M-71]|uniref:O-antigen polymerase n=1 Tax=[Phormidium ambiguum] IAM M-71 TaxID=454136 RepID=A0A1U7IL67_9CYAN|nr:hypothetical protein [Phormidium ambiguum]OKH37915.1 hypothetical protein NIES2119_12290 [Phormidium ambiguum IAM M-71]
MYTEAKVRPKKTKKKGYIQLSTLMLFAFSSAFFPRVLSLIKFPSIINLLHLGIVPWACIFTLTKTKVKDRKQIAAIKELSFALIFFLCVNLASAILNDAGIINVILNYLLLCEHFLLLLTIISLPLTPEKLIGVRAYIIFASITNTVFAYVQRYVLNLHLRRGLEDNIKGVFIGQGAGHVVGSSVALTFGVYYFFTAKNIPIWIRSAMLLATFWHMNMADAKQVLLSFAVGGVLLLFTKFKSIGEALKFLIGGALLGYGFFWCMQNVPAFDAFNTWMRPEIYGPDGEATRLKSVTFRVVPTFYTSFLNPLLGIGPGHTVTRLGGWMLEEYQDLLAPLGPTIHPASKTVWLEVAKSWLGDQSSMFSPLFGWAGIWGDLGLLGLGSFLYIWFVVLRRLCINDISKLFVFTICAFGLVFSQMEEPGYMLHVTTLIGVMWHEHQCERKMKPGESLDQLIIQRPKSIKDWIKYLLRMS